MTRHKYSRRLMRFPELGTFQLYHRRWLEHNFPNQTSHQALLGLFEEIGELAHAHLKHEQKIRGLTDEEFQIQAEDAIGDLFIYAASYCNTNGLSLQRALEKAWEEVSERDWIKFPRNGVST